MLDGHLLVLLNTQALHTVNTCLLLVGHLKKSLSYQFLSGSVYHALFHLFGYASYQALSMKFFQTQSFAVLALGSRHPKSAWLPAHTCGQQKPKCTVDEPFHLHIGGICGDRGAGKLHFQERFDVNTWFPESTVPAGPELNQRP